ncbi:uncharacterized protein LOC123003737 [Tribolium madens]|uniref:uncharacterized protein LOC123003737 n=1 Tax=Tribolium madens TaxID=41895 RepID=UPI001CF71D9A|nr:uncharacterized protein LOC123003737 [Tribolium madens]
MIKHVSSGLVLDARSFEVQMQVPTRSKTQLWKQQTAGLGKFYLVNRANGKVLDINDEGKPNNKLITFPKHGGPNQQWFNNFGQLASDYKNVIIAAQDKDVKAVSNYGTSNEMFTFVLVCSK